MMVAATYSLISLPWDSLVRYNYSTHFNVIWPIIAFQNTSGTPTWQLGLHEPGLRASRYSGFFSEPTLLTTNQSLVNGTHSDPTGYTVVSSYLLVLSLGKKKKKSDDGYVTRKHLKGLSTHKFWKILHAVTFWCILKVFISGMKMSQNPIFDIKFYWKCCFCFLFVCFFRKWQKIKKNHSFGKKKMWQAKKNPFWVKKNIA